MLWVVLGVMIIDIEKHEDALNAYSVDDSSEQKPK